MKAFYGIPELKEHYLGRLKWHMDADHLARGVTGNFAIQKSKFRGCAVACSMERYDHSAYETEWQVPEWLAYVEDTFFESMSIEKSKTWPYEFAAAINVGSNLNEIKTPFILLVLESSIESMTAAQFDAIKFPDVKKAIDESISAVRNMIRCHTEGLDLTAAARLAQSAAQSAESAESAARSAESAVWSAESAAQSAESAARSAKSAAWSARSAAWLARSAAWPAESAKFDYFADELLKLIRGCK